MVHLRTPTAKTVAGASAEGARQFAPVRLRRAPPGNAHPEKSAGISCHFSATMPEIRGFGEGSRSAMKESQKKFEASQYLSGWKEVSAYLGKGVRTVQRYERELGLPVRRPAGKSSGSVIALKAELDGWVQASPIRKTFQLRTKSSEQSLLSHSLKQHVMELGRLRAKMSELRSETDALIRQLQESVTTLVQARQIRYENAVVSSLYSADERDLLFGGKRLHVTKAS
jgi:hypothetical protein